MDHRQAVQSAMAAAAGEQPPEEVVPQHYHWLLRLPARFWSEMHHYLDYTEILGLALLSSQFYDRCLEEFFPWTARHAAVARLEIATCGQKKCACYLCFRIRDIDEFQKAEDLVTHARVVQRDWYRGRRLFERAPPPSPGQQNAVVGPPSPVARMGSFYLAGGAAMPGMGVSMGVGVPVPVHMDMDINMSMVAVSSAMRGVNLQGPLLPVQIPASTTTMVQRARRWRPRAPGAEVGQIESLRRYCIDCAIETRLLSPGDMLTRRGENFWLCHCRTAHRQEDNESCPACGMNPVYRA